MKPFDLGAALAGAPVVTRDGKPVQELHLFKSATTIHSLYGVINGHVNSFTPSTGRYYDDQEHDKDLFMASTRKTGWINVYPAPYERQRNFCNTHSIHATKEDADEYAGDNRVACIAISWEE